MDPDVVETACLAHDLGHPPFGHAAEDELNRCVRLAGDADGFEGNAQTFRILTRLSAASDEWQGLNLTRASLAATLKYPWYFGEGATDKKWGAYRVDGDDFEWAVAERGRHKRPLEAEIMDWADDIAYAIHDLEDFYRAGLIPLDRIAKEVEDLGPIKERVIERWPTYTGEAAPTGDELAGAITNVLDFPITHPFRGTRTERADLRPFTSFLVGQLVTSTRLDGDELKPDRQARVLTEFLKQLTWHYVIDRSPLLTLQVGQRRAIRGLYGTYRRALTKGQIGILPTRWEEEARVAVAEPDTVPRLVADIIAAMKEEEARATYHRLAGASGGFLDPIVS